MILFNISKVVLILNSTRCEMQHTFAYSGSSSLIDKNKASLQNVNCA